MTFSTPTTLEEMYAVLRQIFLYYRVKRQRYEGVLLDPLTLDRIQIEQTSEQELKEKAKLLLSAKHAQEILDYKNSLVVQIEAVNKKISAIPKSQEILIEQLKKEYGASERKIEEKAIQNGLINSSVIFDKLCVLEQDKNAQINKIMADSEKSKAELESELLSLTSKLENADAYFAQIQLKEIDVKAKELFDQSQAVAREIFKFNCAQEEKEQRYRNDIVKTNASLEIRYLEINADDFTKDQLVEMGYYDDVIDCVGAYLNSLEPSAAYEIVKSKGRIAVYLEHYYEHILSMYKVRAEK